ncbi:MAG: hypothetical protein RB296_07480 [Acidobacteriota bacterium]|jgi:hypothetical protein|nr:hypothetical protein [Acidobacteriota bacterium]
MKRLDLNMAVSPRLDWLRFCALVLLFLSAAALLIWHGTRSLTRPDGLDVEQRRELQSLREAEKGFAADMESVSGKIRGLKQQWEPRVRFANALIARKSFSFVTRLDLLEKLLSANVFLQRLTIDQGNPQRLEMEIVAPSFNDLIDAYRQLAAHQLEVKSEIKDPAGQYRVSLNMRVKP